MNDVILLNEGVSEKEIALINRETNPKDKIQMQINAWYNARINKLESKVRALQQIIGND